MEQDKQRQEGGQGREQSEQQRQQQQPGQQKGGQEADPTKRKPGSEGERGDEQEKVG